MANKPESFTIDFFPPFVKFGGLVIPLRLLVSGPTATKKILDLKSLAPNNLHSQLPAGCWGRDLNCSIQYCIPSPTTYSTLNKYL